MEGKFCPKCGTECNESSKSDYPFQPFIKHVDNAPQKEDDPNEQQSIPYGNAIQNTHAKKCMYFGIASPILLVSMVFLNLTETIMFLVGAFLPYPIAMIMGYFFYLLWLVTLIASIVNGAQSLQKEKNNKGFLFIGFLCDGIVIIIALIILNRLL